MKRLYAIAASVALVLGFGVAGAQADDSCIPQAAWTEVIVDEEAWTEVIEHPATSHEVVHPAVTTTENIVHVWVGGPVEGAPPVDSPDWHPTSGEFNGKPHQQPVGVPYRTGNGNGDWFLRVLVTTVISEEWTETVIDSQAWTETVDHPAVTHEVFHPEVICEDPETPVDPEPCPDDSLDPDTCEPVVTPPTVCRDCGHTPNPIVDVCPDIPGNQRGPLCDPPVSPNPTPEEADVAPTRDNPKVVIPTSIPARLPSTGA